MNNEKTFEQQLQELEQIVNNLAKRHRSFGRSDGSV